MSNLSISRTPLQLGIWQFLPLVCLLSSLPDALCIALPFPGSPGLNSEQQQREKLQPLKHPLGFILDFRWQPLLCSYEMCVVTAIWVLEHLRDWQTFLLPPFTSSHYYANTLLNFVMLLCLSNNFPLWWLIVWVIRCTDNLVKHYFWVFLEEKSVWVGELSKTDCPTLVGGHHPAHWEPE